MTPPPYRAAEGRHPRLYFGGASAAAEQVSATEADVQLFWGEPLDGIAKRIDRLRALARSLGRVHAPLEFGLRITTLVRDTTEEAWRDAEAKVARLAEHAGTTWLVGSHDEVAAALRKYTELGITHFVLSDTPLPARGRPRRRPAAEAAARPGHHLTAAHGLSGMMPNAKPQCTRSSGRARWLA